MRGDASSVRIITDAANHLQNLRPVGLRPVGIAFRKPYHADLIDRMFRTREYFCD